VLAVLAVNGRAAAVGGVGGGDGVGVVVAHGGAVGVLGRRSRLRW
jgi:hypothetical protein